jgi:long-chain acyl-CoA synthetase
MLAALLRQSVARHPDRLAIVQAGRRITYRELAAHVAALARRLDAAGLGEGDRVGLVLPNVPEFAIAFFALARLGAIAVPQNPGLSPGEIARSLERVAPAGVLAGPAWCERLAPLLADPTFVPLRFGESPPAGALPEAGEPFAGDVLIQASSGSTGLAKWVCRTQRNLVAEADGFGEAAQTGPGDVVLGAPPLFHSHGLCNGMLASLRAGACLVLLDRPVGDDAAPDPPFALRCGHVLELLQRERVTILPGVPFMFEALAITGRRAKPDLGSLRLCFSAGNFLPERTHERFRETFGIEIRQLYGCTEAGAVTINLDPAEKADWRSVGSAIPGMEVRAGREPSEIRIRSAALGRYLTGELRDAEGWFATGDLGRQDELGRLWITGRTKLFIDSGGYKVDPVEVEEVLVAHEHVEEAAVVGVADPTRGEEIRAFVVLSEPVSPSALIGHCRAQLAAFKVPRRIEVRASLPRSALGKLLRGQLMGRARS